MPGFHLWRWYRRRVSPGGLPRRHAGPNLSRWAEAFEGTPFLISLSPCVLLMAFHYLPLVPRNRIVPGHGGRYTWDAKIAGKGMLIKYLRLQKMQPRVFLLLSRPVDRIAPIENIAT